jgi:aspartate aminotransferase
VQYYPYYLVESQKIDIKAMIRCLEEAPSKSLVVLQGCAHNPTGLDPSQEEWRQIADVMAEKGHFPFFDNAYQGFASGDLTQDSWACRYFIGRGFECCVAQSFAKNLGMYGERVGAFHYICSPSPDASHVADRISSQLAILQRAHISNPPAYGAHIASRVLNDPKLFSQWQHELGIISGRLTKVREEIRSKLEGRETPGSWAFLSTQIGMFSYTGLSKNQIRLLKSKWHIYMVSSLLLYAVDTS